MQDFASIIPTRFFAGEECLAQNTEAICLGRHAFIVTGRSSAKRSGALDDLTRLFERAGVSYTVYAEITENPPILTCYAGGRLAYEVGADFVVGIGGGSPLDAAKAIAAYAANPAIEPEEIFEAAKRIAPSLPIIAIPTTAGTGSEANPYSILTLRGGQRKQTFNAPESWPKYSFLDPRYTASLPISATVSCALDAFAHALESFLSPKSTELSQRMALWAAEKIWPILSARPAEYTPAMRESLLYAATAAGMAISVTGTGFPHPMGYSLTLLDGIPHGRACAIFDGDYIRCNARTEEGKRRLHSFAEAIGSDPDTLARLLPELAEVDLHFSEEQIAEHVELIAGAKNYVNSPYVLKKDEIYALYRAHFGG